MGILAPRAGECDSPTAPDRFVPLPVSSYNQSTDPTPPEGASLPQNSALRLCPNLDMGEGPMLVSDYGVLTPCPR